MEVQGHSKAETGRVQYAFHQWFDEGHEHQRQLGQVVR
jgi:hypothetical protein